MNIFKFVSPRKAFVPGKIATPFSSWKEGRSEESFWYHAPQCDVGSALLAKVHMHHKGLFCHLCLC